LTFLTYFLYKAICGAEVSPLKGYGMSNEVKEGYVGAFGLGVLANVLWATSFLGSKYTLMAWGPFTASFLRFVLAVLAMTCLFPLIGIKLRLPKRSEWKAIILVGLFQFGLLYPLQLFGLQHISTSLSAAIMLFSPLLVITFASALLSERINVQKIVAILIGIGGGLVLLQEHLTAGGDSLLGVILTIGASLCLAIGIVLTRKHGQNVETPQLTLWSMLVGSVILFPFVIFESSNLDGLYFSWSNHYPAIIALIYLAVVCSAFTFYIWNKALTLSPTKTLASTMHLKTPVAIIIGVLVAREDITSSMLIGAGIVFFGVWLSQARTSLRLPSFSNQAEKPNEEVVYVQR
jgi:probable blue pigment (indigoidine) exporter